MGLATIRLRSCLIAFRLRENKEKPDLATRRLSSFSRAPARGANDGDDGARRSRACMSFRSMPDPCGLFRHPIPYIYARPDCPLRL